MIFQSFSLVTLLPVARHNHTVMLAGVARQGFLRRKCRLTWHILSRQRMWRDSVIWSLQRDWRDQKGQIRKIFLKAITIKILNKKRLKIKKIHAAAGPPRPPTYVQSYVGVYACQQIRRAPATGPCTHLSWWWPNQPWFWEKAGILCVPFHWSPRFQFVG